jgi:hypothetical protein
MRSIRTYWWTIMMLIVVLGVGCRSKPNAKTDVDMLVYGGFAYVPSGNTLEIAYMKPTDKDGCKVTPIGTELLVLDGDIVDAQPNAIPANKKFNLAGAVVTFPDMEKGTAAIAVRRPVRPALPPAQPADPANPAQWEDLVWVASTGDDFKNSNPISPQWRNLVDGRVVLTGGKLVGVHPDDGVVQASVWDFKHGYTAPITAPAVYRQALTDQTKYTVTLHKDQIVMNLTGSKAGWTRIVVKPSTPGRTVKLKLSGLHAHETSSDLKVGEPMLDFCQFYQILQPIPVPDQQLIPYFMGDGSSAAPPPPGTTPKTQPSPGLFCGGDINP